MGVDRAPTARRCVIVFAAFLVLAAPLWAQRRTVEPPPESGQGVTAAFEGWFPNKDGTFEILFGYYNRNSVETPDVPIGPQNRIEPGGPDRGQPIHFLPLRQWGVFTVTVPADFGEQKLVWTIEANGAQARVPAHLDPLWEVSPFEDVNGNTPPFIAFDPNGPFHAGPAKYSKSIEATVGSPVELEVWVADDAHLVEGATRPASPPVSVGWSKFRGVGAVAFGEEAPAVDAASFDKPGSSVFTGRASTTATFNVPGDYVLRVVANDWSGDGGRGFQCCWTNAEVKVSVTPAH